MFKFLILIASFIALWSCATAQDKSLTIPQYAAAAAQLGIKELATLKAIDDVESGGSGFLKSSGRPKILFERHLFHRFTNPVGRFSVSHPDISNSRPGGYAGEKLSGVDWNVRSNLMKAQLFVLRHGADSRCAFGSAIHQDIGLFISPDLFVFSPKLQILGSHFALCGYQSPQALRRRDAHQRGVSSRLLGEIHQGIATVDIEYGLSLHPNLIFMHVLLLYLYFFRACVNVLGVLIILCNILLTNTSRTFLFQCFRSLFSVTACCLLFLSVSFFF